MSGPTQRTQAMKSKGDGRVFHPLQVFTLAGKEGVKTGYQTRRGKYSLYFWMEVKEGKRRDVLKRLRAQGIPVYERRKDNGNRLYIFRSEHYAPDRRVWKEVGRG